MYITFFHIIVLLSPIVNKDYYYYYRRGRHTDSLSSFLDKFQSFYVGFTEEICKGLKYEIIYSEFILKKILFFSLNFGGDYVIL